MQYDNNYPFSLENVSDDRPLNPNPLVTPGFFNEYGVLPSTGQGNPRRVDTSASSDHCLAIPTAEAIRDFCVNVKTLWYNFFAVYTVAVGEDIFSYTTTETIDVKGLAQRFLVSPANRYANKFMSVNRGGVNVSTTQALNIDFTKSFYDLRQATQGKRFYWFPFITFTARSANGGITPGLGSGMSSANLDFANFLFTINPIPITVDYSGEGSLLNIDAAESAIYTTERYDTIYFSKSKVAPGDSVDIIIPAWKKNRNDRDWDSPSYRTGFADVTKLTFGGGQPVAITPAMKIKNANDVVDTLRVVVPQNAKTDVVKFEAVSNTQSPANHTDIYSSSAILHISAQG